MQQRIHRKEPLRAMFQSPNHDAKIFSQLWFEGEDHGFQKMFALVL